ncbi:unnamed protein product [Cylindrotheca closterium]|uniref:Kinesin light chain n=1 Tax=Cylindrotheca closterium TaxID=2856 RepID=A0AAD2CQJ9_9STRA|nr:unnamed protein product [Cylindrotheca closterium]
MEENEQDSVEELIRQAHLYYYKEGNFQKAKEIFDSVLEIKTKELGEDDPDVACTLYLIGFLLTLENHDNEALEQFERALEIQLKILGEKHKDTAKTYQMIGEVYGSLGNFDKAEEMLHKAVDIKLDILPNDDHFEGTKGLYQSLANLLKKQGKFSETVKIYKSQLATLLKKHGECHSDVVEVYAKIAELLRIQHRPDDALQMIGKSIDLCFRLLREQGNCDNQLLTELIDSKADTAMALKNFEAATRGLSLSLKIQIVEFGEMHRFTALAYQRLGVVYAQRDMTEDALLSFEKAIGILRNVFGNDHPETKNAVLHHGLTTAKACENVSALKLDQGLLQDAIDLSAGALKILRRDLDEDHATTKRRMEAHRSLLKLLLENRGN